jgi:ABC-type uncharacterized transport system auxiliary subunit
VIYYTLAVPGRPQAASPWPVRVGAFSADAPYATSRLAWRSSPFRLEYYAFHRWADSAPGALATAARDYLAQAAPTQGGAPLVLEGHLRRLEALADPAGWRGVVVLDLSLRRSGQVWLERSYEESEPAAADTAEAVVAALSRALGRVLDRLLEDLGAAGEPGGLQP